MPAQQTAGGPPERIEAVFRTGTITVVGFMVAFSLGFLTAWAANPIPWGMKDLPPLVVLVVGMVFELLALAALLRPDCLELPRYQRAVRLFLIGLSLVAAGVVLALVVDFLATLDT